MRAEQCCVPPAHQGCSPWVVIVRPQPDPWEHLRRLLNWGPRTNQRHILRLAKMRIWNLDNRDGVGGANITAVGPYALGGCHMEGVSLGGGRRTAVRDSLAVAPTADVGA